MPEVLPTSDFTPVADWYDATRNLPDDRLAELFRRVAAAVAFAAPQRILDAGCGTAQLSVPLLRAGHHVVGVDIAAAMLRHARAKVQPGWHSLFIQADVRRLGFPSDCFDAVVVSKLFQHVGGWRTAVDELRRVTRDGGLFMHINEKGAFKNAVRQRFARECDARGYVRRYPGIQDRAQLGAYVRNLGGRPIPVSVEGLEWTKTITYREALRHLELRLHAEFWAIPDAPYEEILDAVRRWIDEQPAGGDTVESMTPYLTAEIFQWEPVNGA